MITLYNGNTGKKFEYSRKTLEDWIKEEFRTGGGDQGEVVLKFLAFVQRLCEIQEIDLDSIQITIKRITNYNIYSWEKARANLHFDLTHPTIGTIFSNSITNMPYNCGIGVLQRFENFYKLGNKNRNIDKVIKEYVEFIHHIYTDGYYKAFVITLNKNHIVTKPLLENGFTVSLDYLNKDGNPFQILTKTFNERSKLEVNYDKIKERLYAAVENKESNSETSKKLVTKSTTESSSEDWLNNISE
jgi:hypothetical protein